MVQNGLEILRRQNFNANAGRGSKRFVAITWNHLSKVLLFGGNLQYHLGLKKDDTL